MAVVPVYNMITVPHSHIYLQTNVYQAMTGRVPTENERVTVIVAKKEYGRRELNGDSFYPVGVSGAIREVNDQGYLVIHLGQRVNLDEVYVYPDKTIELTVSRRAEVEDLDPQEAVQRLTAVKEALLSLSREFEWGKVFRGFVAAWETLGDIGAGLSPWMSAGNEDRYALLAEDSQRARFDALEAMIYEHIELSRVRMKAQTAQQESHQKLYKEQALRKQIEYLQQELDDMHPEELSDLRTLEKKIEDCGMNETARKEARKLLNRLKAEGQNSHESGMLTDYLEFLTSLPWKKEEAKDISLDDAEKILDADHFGLDRVKKRILEQIAVMQLKGKQSGSILLFVGAPGTGKTSIGQSIARALGREYVRVSLGGVRDEADIRGHRRTYIGAMPGRILDGIQKCGVSNPVMVLDEVDKLSASYNGDPASALLEVLDPEQNSNFTDHYLNVPYDLSDVLFICTANTVDTIPEPLLNRMEMIRFQGYTPIEKQEIALRHLLPKAMEAAGLEQGSLAVSDDTVSHVISEYTREAGVRGLKKRIDTLCRSVAVQLVKGAEAPIVVTPEKLREYLDMSPIRQKNVRESAEPGVVTGLAWTQVGGDVLYIETKATRGSGKLTITGQLGDVMKESAQIAVSLVKSMYPDKAELLEKEDLHIHVPDGATPKDGPSAGITLTTALASLVSGVPVPPAVAMTGEVSLQGCVNPIGGLPEKLMAAQRSGVKKVFIPADNVDDLRDVAKEVREKLTIVPVQTVSEVLNNLALTGTGE
ncbi:MAG: endopeptidase La [Oscillospiraceae bacterium]|nr:endopeptidase La [Oscillospiraceae bacterium]